MKALSVIKREESINSVPKHLFENHEPIAGALV